MPDLPSVGGPAFDLNHPDHVGSATGGRNSDQREVIGVGRSCKPTLDGAVVVALMAILLTACLSVGAVHETANGGPLTTARPGGRQVPPAGTSMELAAGAVHSSGLAEVYNPGKFPVHIDNVRAVDGVPGIVVIGALIYPWHQDTANLSNYGPYPPDDKMLGPARQAIGFTIPVGKHLEFGYSIVVGIMGTGVKRATIKQFDIDYDVDGHHYTLVVPITVAVCAPPTTGDNCHPEYAGN